MFYCTLQGIVRKATIQMYLFIRENILRSILESISTREVSTSFFSKVISSNRCLFICKLLHFQDNERFDHIKHTDQIAKTQTVLENILEECKTVYFMEHSWSPTAIGYLTDRTICKKFFF